jgi:cell filamentation protein
VPKFQDPYLYPNSNVLRNKFNIRDNEKLSEIEKEISYKKRKSKPKKGNFGYKHLQSLHKHLFAEIYPWAGETRKIEIAKSNTMFAVSHRIEPEINKLFNRLNQEDLHECTQNELAYKLSEYFNEINAVHPFREGNGRTNRLFCSELAKKYGCKIDWKSMTKEEYINASIKGTLEADYRPMEKLIVQNISKIIPTHQIDLEQNHVDSLKSYQNAISKKSTFKL